MSYPIINSVGWKFRETFDSVGSVLANGGEINGDATVDDGGSFPTNGSSIFYQAAFYGQEISVEIDVDLTFVSGSYQALVSNRGEIADTYFECSIDNTASTTDKKMLWLGGSLRLSTATIPSTTKKLLYVKDSSNNITFYADGVKVGNTVAGTALTTPTLNLYIGNVFSGIYPAKSTIHNVNIYQRALSAEEALDLFEQDTYQEVDDSQFLVSLPLRSNYNDGSDQVTVNRGSLGGTVRLGDGSTSNTFPTQLYPKGMSFDGGADNYLEMAGQTDLDNVFDTGASLVIDLSLAGTGNGGAGRILSKGDIAAGWALYVTASGSGYRVTLSKKFSSATGAWYLTNALTFGKRYHLVLSYDASSTSNVPSVVLNGESVGVSTSAAPSGTSSPDADEALFIGDNNVHSRWIDGIIYGCGIFPGLITPTQAKWLYQKDMNLINQ